MKITAISTETYRWPRLIPITNGRHTFTHASLRLVRVETDDPALTGFGLCNASPIVQAAIEYFTPQLIGENPLAVEHLWHLMYVPKLVGRRGMTTRAIGGIDNALWDLRAKFAGMPLYVMLGGYRSKIPTYITGGYYERDKGLRELERELASNVDAGAKAIKMKVGALSLREDAERVAVARRAVGPDVKLMVDANCAYSLPDAIRFAKMLEPHDIFWFEEPIGNDDYDGHRRLAESTFVPIASGENEYTRFGFRDLMQQRAVSILNPDALVMGGISEFMKVAAMAQAMNVDIAPHGPQELHVHLACAISNGLLLEFYGPAVDPMFGQVYLHTLALNDDGSVSAPEEPGTGIELNRASLERFRVG
jgi:L-alanine-DL-glutamate epimerase-like enolase superfamily enzyme